MNIQEQIAAFEAKRAALAAANTSIMEKAASEGATLDAAQKEAFDGNEADIAEIDGHLKRLKSLLAAEAATAVPVQGQDAKSASESRGGIRVEVKGANAPKGAAFTRFVMALARTKGDITAASNFAASNKSWGNTPEVATVLKAAASVGTTADANWAHPMTEYQGMAAEFVELLRPATIIGRIEGLRQVPFDTKLLIQTGGSLVNWVGEAKRKPVGQLGFETAKMDTTKVAGIVVLSDELVRSSSVNAETTVKDDLTNQIAQFLDKDFVDPAKVEVAGVSPASITNGAGTRGSGNSADAVRIAVNAALGEMLSANLSSGDVVAIMAETTALFLSSLRTALDQPAFPGISMTGGTFEGRPAITSQTVPAGVIILAKASEIMVADDGQVLIDVSKEATLVMDNAPTDAMTPNFNLWQNNAIGIRAERFINWKRRRAAAVQVITGVGTTV